MTSGDRAILLTGMALVTLGIWGTALQVASSSPWSHFYSPMGSMMGWRYGPLDVVSGTVLETGMMEIELDSNGKKIEVHAPYWFWQLIGIKVGDTVTVKGARVFMMGHGEGWHEELIPFELTVNGKTFGETNSRLPVWMQE